MSGGEPKGVARAISADVRSIVHRFAVEGELVVGFVCGWNLGVELITDAADGADHGPGESEFFADGGDVDIDGAGGDDDAGPHDAVDEVVTREDALGGAKQRDEEFVFGERERHFGAVDGAAVAVEINGYGTNSQGGDLLRGQGSAEEGPHPG